MTTFSIEVEAPDLEAGQRHIMAAEVVLDEVDFGEKAEMIIAVE